MVMPLTVRDREEFIGLEPGDEITFRLWVTADEDWIDQVEKTGRQVEIDLLPECGGRFGNRIHCHLKKKYFWVSGITN